MAENRWYAVRESRDAAWDNGSDDYQTAVAMLKDQGHGLIAVINENSGVCEEEITYEEIFERLKERRHEKEAGNNRFCEIWPGCTGSMETLYTDRKHGSACECYTRSAGKDAAGVDQDLFYIRACIHKKFPLRE